MLYLIDRVSVSDMESLKKEILKLLEKDVEFRYAVAGYLGLSEIIKRLDRHEEELVKLREDMNMGFRRHDEELAKLREDMNKLREDMVAGFRRHDEEIAKLREDMIAGFKRHDEELAKLREDMVNGFKRHDREIIELREDFNEMLREIRSIDVRLSRVERTLEKLTLDIEEEAREILKYRIKKELGLDMEIESLILEDLELNLYGASDEVCIIGEASVRAGIRVLETLLNKIDMLRKKYPEKLKEKVILVIYTSLALPELVDEAVKNKVWVLKATGDVTKLQIWRPI